MSAESAAREAVQDFRWHVGNPDVTAVNLAVYPESGIRVQFRGAPAEVPWPRAEDGWVYVDVEYGETRQIFRAPKDQRLVDYLTGRFG